MIPKIIHYCWFGGNPLDEKAEKCIQSWRRFFPDYEIVRWDESNFDVNQILFMKEAYDHHKWAFVSDVARLLVIYQHGGIYFDTDVEVLRPYDDTLAESPTGFFGFERTQYVNTGLGYAADKGDPFLAELIDVYKTTSFSDYLSSLSELACPIVMTQFMETQGYLRADKMQVFRGFRVYPSSYFSPLDYDTGQLHIKNNTHAIHWGNASWNDEVSRSMRSVQQRYNRIFGKAIGERIFGIHSSIKKEGFVKYVKRHLLLR